MIGIIWMLIKLMFGIALICAVLILGIYGIYKGLIGLYCKLFKKDALTTEEKVNKMFEKAVDQIANQNFDSVTQNFSLLQNIVFCNQLKDELKKLSSLSYESTKMQDINYLGFRIFEIEFVGQESNQNYFEIAIKRAMELIGVNSEIHTRKVKIDNQENHVLFSFCYALNGFQRKALSEFKVKEQEQIRKLEIDKLNQRFVEDQDLEKEFQQYGL